MTSREILFKPFLDFHNRPPRGLFVIVAGMNSLIGRFIQHGDLRLVRDPDNSFWLSLNNGKRKDFAETHNAWNEDSVAYDHGRLFNARRTRFSNRTSSERGVGLT